VLDLGASGLEVLIDGLYFLFGQSGMSGVCEGAGDAGVVRFSAQNTVGQARVEAPTDGDEPMAEPAFPPSGEPFSWDDWTQSTAPFLWTLADIAHALGTDLPTAKRWHDEGNIPAPAWSEPILWRGILFHARLWHGDVVKPWIDEVLALTQQITQALTQTALPPGPTPDPTEDTPHDTIEDTPQDATGTPDTIDLTLHNAGLLSFDDIAKHLGQDLTTLRQWHYEGCPGHPMPYPDLIEKSVPYWFYDGKIADWIDTLPTSLTKTHNRTSLNPKAVLDARNPRPQPEKPAKPKKPKRPAKSTGHTLPIEPILPDTNLVSLPEIARTTGIPIPTLRDWAVHGIFCPPLDVSPPTVPGYGYWHRDTIIPWLAKHDTHNKNTRPQNKPPAHKSREDTEVPSSHRTTIRQGEETNMGKLWNETQQNFERLGDTATHTDLANLAGDYPQLLAHATQLDRLPDWLIKTADRLALAGFWNAFNITEDAITGNTSAATFARGARGLWLYRNGTLEDAGACLATAARSRLLPQNARDLFTLRNAAVLRLTGGYDIALHTFNTLTGREGSLGIQARYWTACTHLAQGNYHAGLDTLPTPDELPDITGDYWIDMGWARGECAQTDKAIHAQKKAVEYARSTRSIVAEGKTLSYLARAEAWTNPDAAKTHAQEAIRLTQQTGNLIDQQNALVALAIATAGTGTDEEFCTTLQEAQDLAYRTGNRRSTLRASFACAWHAAIKNDDQALNRSIAEIESLSTLTKSRQHWADIARAWLPGQTRETTQLAARWQWLDSPEDTMRRWRQLLDNRKALAA